MLPFVTAQLQRKGLCTSIASSTFGRIKDTAVSGSRKIQVALKDSF